jgi:hypothetical protein
MIKAVISAAVMGVGVFFVYGFVGARFDGVVGNILTCGICGVTGVIIYGIMIFVTGEDDIKSIIKKKG